MNDEKIKVRVTASGQTLDVVVLNKRVERIEIVLGEGVHNVRCDLVPTRNGSAYVGNAMGREIVYERSRDEVKADLVRAAGFRDFKR
jgi:hypothetical protein